jgi:hypothetical protein
MVNSVRLIMAMINGRRVFSLLGRRLCENRADRYYCASQTGRNDFPSIDHSDS